MWRGAAVVIGLALAGGVGVDWWLSPPEPIGWSTAPIEYDAVQDVPKAAATSSVDTEWLARGDDALAESDLASPAVRARFGLCHSGGGTNCVVDGDTIWVEGRNIRIADIDAPETHEARCAAEQALGDRATRRLHQLVNGGAVTLASSGRDRDRYGRQLRIVAVDGSSVGETLVGEGLARWYAGGRRSWC